MARVHFEKDSLHAGDCLDLMRMMPNKYVDLCFTSPPYENARTYGIGFNLKAQDWVDWSVERFVECLRVTKGLVAWVVEGRTADFRWSATPALLMADLHRHGVNLRKPPAFHRVGIAGSGGREWLRNDYEFIVCATHGKLPWSDNTACGHKPKYAPGGAMSHRLSNGTRRNQWGHSGEGETGSRKSNGKRDNSRRKSHVVVKNESPNDPSEDGRYLPPVKANPGNVLKYAVGGGVMGSKLCHENEAPFPLKLAEFFVKSFCPPGGTVLDPHCGSGTVAHAAIMNDRHYIGFDCRESQIELSRQRVVEALQQKAKEQAK